MPTLKLDGREVEFNQGESLIQVCDREGVEIPRFCYHDRLKIAGNCAEDAVLRAGSGRVGHVPARVRNPHAGFA